MRKSVKLFGIIIIVFFLADRAIFYGLSYLENDVYTGLGVGKVNSFLKVKDSVDLLVFGSSRAAHHVNFTTVTTSNFNMGRDATKIAFASALISTLKKPGQTILVHIDHNTLYDESYTGEKDAQRLAFNALKDSDISGFFKKHFHTEFLLGEISHTYASNGKMLSILKNKIAKGYDYSSNNGYEPIFPTADQSIAFKKIIGNQRDGFIEKIKKPLKVNPKLEEFINEIVKATKNNKSRLIFFTSPSLNKVDKTVKNRTKTFFESKGISYLDHIDFFDSIEYTQWKDRTHLSDQGATQYSEFLKNIIGLR